jgi:hypothetical protein
MDDLSTHDQQDGQSDQGKYEAQGHDDANTQAGKKNLARCLGHKFA